MRKILFVIFDRIFGKIPNQYNMLPLKWVYIAQYFDSLVSHFELKHKQHYSSHGTR